MEIKLNEESLSKIVNEEVLRKLDEQEQTIKKIKYEYAKSDVLAKDYMIDKIEEFCGEQENCHGCSLKLSDYCNTLKDEITYNQVKEAFDVLNKQEETKISCNIEECNANKNVKQIDILGEKYNIYFDVDPKGKELEGKTLGVCYRSRREIYIANLEQDTDWKNEPAYAKENKLKEIIIHEVIQAFLNESGLKSNSLCCDFSWVENEQMIDWIAIQFPKIVKVINLLGVME